MDKEFEDKFNKLCSKMKNDFPEEFKACAIALNERKNIWIKDNETNEIIECPVNFFDHLSNVDEVLDKYDKFWYVVIGLVSGEERLLIEIHSYKDYMWHMEHLPGFNYFAPRYNIRDYKKTWWDYNPLDKN